MGSARASRAVRRALALDKSRAARWPRKLADGAFAKTREGVCAPPTKTRREVPSPHLEQSQAPQVADAVDTAFDVRRVRAVRTFVHDQGSVYRRCHDGRRRPAVNASQSVLDHEPARDLRAADGADSRRVLRRRLYVVQWHLQERAQEFF